MFKEEKMLNTENNNLDNYFNEGNNNNTNSNNNNARKFANYKLNSRDSYTDYDQQNNIERFGEKVEPYFNNINNSNSKQITPALSSINSNNNSFKNPSPPQKKLTNSNNNHNQEENKFNFGNNNSNNGLTNRNSFNNGNFRKPFDSIIPGSFEKPESFATASDSVSLNSADDQNNLELSANKPYRPNNSDQSPSNKPYRPSNLLNNNNNTALNNNNIISNSQILNNSNTYTNNNTTNNKNPKVLLKIDENPKKNLQFQLDEKSKEQPPGKEAKEVKFKAKETPMKSRNNQSTFAKNPSQSYAEPYYASFPPNDRPPKVPLSYFGFSQYSPREQHLIYPYVVPSPYGPLAQYIPAAAFPYHSPTGVLSYNLLLRPLMLDEKNNPSLHDLLYYDTFRNKDVPYASKHIEKKIRAVDGFYNPYGRYTIQDYRNLKANEAFASTNNELDPETKDDKAEKMHKRQEVGNLFMKSNPKPPRKPVAVQPDPDAPVPPPQRRAINLQEPFDLGSMGGGGGRNQRQEPNSVEENDNDSDYNHKDYYEISNKMNNYMPSFYNNSHNAFTTNRSLNNMNNSKPDWDDDLMDDKIDSKLTQSQKQIQINHPTKKFYKNPKFNFNEKPAEVPLVETRQRAIEYAKRIKD